MANFHFTAKVLKRSKGRNAVQSAAYRHAQAYKCERNQAVYTHNNKHDVVHSEISIPENAPQWAQDLKAMDVRKASEKLWNAVEMTEKRKDAQVGREIEFSIPHELDEQQRIDFVRDFIQENITSRGMIADWAIHNHYDEENKVEKPHVHIGLTMRQAVDSLTVENGKIYSHKDIHLGNKDRSWNSKAFLKELRQSFEICQNKHLEMAYVDRRVDHRTYEEQGIPFLPQPKLGKGPAAMMERGETVERVKEYEAVRDYNRNIVLQNPEVVLDYITKGQSDFNRTDIAKVLNRYLTDEVEFDQTMQRIEASEQLVVLYNPLEKTQEKFTTQAKWSETREKWLEDLRPFIRELNTLHATFTEKDIYLAIGKRFGDDPIVVCQVFEKVMKEVHAVGKDMDGWTRYTSADYKQREEEVIRVSQSLAQSKFKISIQDTKIEQAFERQPEGRKLSAEQQNAVRTLVSDHSFAVLNGLAGTGKTTTIKVVADLYKAEGCRVMGASVSALAADKLGSEAGIQSRTLESWLLRWDKYEKARQEFLSFKGMLPQSVLDKTEWYKDLQRHEKDRLTRNDVVILDEISMLGIKDAQRVLHYVHQSGAKGVFLGDQSQLQAINAGNFVDVAIETSAHSGSFAEMKEIRRQKEAWMQKASVLFGEGQIQAALSEYEKRGCVQGLKAEEAIAKIAHEYVYALKQGESLNELLVATPLNTDRKEINAAIRQELRKENLIGAEDLFTLRHLDKETGPQSLAKTAKPNTCSVERSYALGDMIIFLDNDAQSEKYRKIAIYNQAGEFQKNEVIKNGSLAVIQRAIALEEGGFQVQVKLLGEQEAFKGYGVFKTADYSAFDHANCVTITKSQGQTKNQVWGYNPDDAFATYVVMTRHRTKVSLVYSTEKYPTYQKFSNSLSRGTEKDNSRDWQVPSHDEIYYERVLNYKRLGIQAAELYQDNDLKKQGVATNRAPEEHQALSNAFKQIQDQRKALALEIVKEWQEHQPYTKRAGLREESLKITAGLIERPLSRAEVKAANRVENYVGVALKARALLTTIRATPGYEEFNAVKHPAYSKYEEYRDKRDSLAAKIVEDKVLHRQFVNDHARLSYGLGVMEKQAKAYEDRLEQAPQLEKIKGLIQQWKDLTQNDSLEKSVSRLEQGFGEDFTQRGAIAAQLITWVQEEKTLDKIRLTYPQLSKDGIAYFDLLREATVYKAYESAQAQGNEAALHLIFYQQARQVTNQLFGQCSREVEKLKEIFAENKQQNPDVFENKPEPVFWHAASYQPYIQATAITNDRAFTLTQGKPFADLPGLQTLTEEMKLSDKLLKGIDLYSRQGEYQFQCREFKGATDSVVKGEKASLLIDELIENKGLFRVFEREQVKMSGLLESLHDHDVRQKKDRLDLSNHPLAEAVFGYTDQRKVVGQAFAEISQEIERRVQEGAEKGILIIPPRPWDIHGQWGVYLKHRQVLDAQAAAILHSSPEERETFVDHFNLRLSVLKPQSQRHHFAQAYQQTKDLSLSYQDRAQAFYVLEEAHQSRFDQALKQIAPYVVNKDDKAQEKIDRDYLKSVQTYSHYAFAPLRQNREKIEDFKTRQAAFEQEFKLNDPQGYQQALKDKEEKRQTTQQQQEQILSDLKQRFNIPEKGAKVQSLEANQTPQRALESQHLAQDIVIARNQSAYAIAIPGQTVKRNHYDSPITAKEVREKLNSRMEDLAFELLEPVHGKPTYRTAHTWRYGNNGSLLVNISGPKQGLFMNFETEQGGDALKLIQNHYGTDYKEAYKWAVSWLGENQKHYELTAKDKGLSSKEKNREEAQWTPIFPAPKEFPDLNSYSLRYMMKDKTEKAHFAYKDAEGNILGYVVRLEDAEGRKSTPPLTYCRNDKGQTQWKWKGFVGEDRPLYGLDQLALKKEAVVLVVEGEKAAEAAKTLFPDHAVVSWMGGSYGVPKADWSVLKDREVVMWPDQDEPGRKAAHKIQEILTTHQNPNVAIVDVPSIFPAKWDLADALPEGVEHRDLKNYVSAAKIARKYELFDQEQKLNLDVSHLAVSSPSSSQAASLSMAEGIGRSESSSIVPQEKDVLAYSESQGEKKAITINDLAVEAPVLPQQTLKVKETSLAQTVVEAEVNPSPTLSAVSEGELVKGYLEIDEQIKAIPTAASRTEEEKERYKALFNSSLAISHQISQSPQAMEAITVLGLEDTVTLKAENYQRIYQAQPQQGKLEEVKQDHEIFQKAKTEQQQTPDLSIKPAVSQQMETKDISRIDIDSRSTSHASREPQPVYNEYAENTPEVKKGFFTKMLHKMNGREKEEQIRALAQEQARQQQKAEALRQQQELEKVKQMSLHYDYSKTMDWKTLAQEKPDQFFEKYEGLYKDYSAISLNPFEPNEELKNEQYKIAKYQRENLESMSNIILKDDKLYAQAFDKGYREVFDRFAPYDTKEERREKDNQFVKDYLTETSEQSVDRKDILRRFSMLEQEHNMIKRLQLEKTPNYKDRYPVVEEMIEKMSLKIASEEQTYTQAKELGLTPTIDKCVEKVDRQIRREQQRALERSMDTGMSWER